MSRQWVLAAPINEAFWVFDTDAQDYVQLTLSPEQAARYVTNTNLAIDAWAQDAADVGGTPYLPPVLSAHQPGGWRGGSIHRAKVATVDGRAGIYLDVEWLPKVAADIEQRHTNFVSIGTRKEYRDYRGRDLGPLIHELSITEDPRLKSLGAIQDTQGLQLSEAITYGAGMDPEEIKRLMALVEALIARVDALEKALADKAAVETEIEAKDGEKKADETTMMDGEGKPEDDIAVQLGEQIYNKALAHARKRLGDVRLGDIPAQKVQTKTVDRRAEGKKRGLTGKALADFELGLTE